jgi:hypothetical protein
MTARPTPREYALGTECADLVHAHASSDAALFVAQALAAYREELLKPFDELRREMHDVGDDKMVRYLDELLLTARGAP